MPKAFRWIPTFIQLDIVPGFGGLAEEYGQQHRVVTLEFDGLLARAVAKGTSPGLLRSCREDARQVALCSRSTDGLEILEVLEHIDDPPLRAHT
jgi:hypothetical protein